MKSVMTHQFSKVPTVGIQRSSFNRSHGHKTTFDAGWLVPVLTDMIYPGDTVRCRMSAFIRLATPLKPFMDNLKLTSFAFFVPHRLTWSNFKRFMGEQDNPADSTSFLAPIMTAPNFAAGGIPSGHLYDYAGLPVGALAAANTGIKFVNFFGRSYNLIWNQCFRDENLQNSVTIDVGDGPDTFANYNLLRRGKRHDYFTSCLPWPQKGADVTLPLGTSAPVTYVPSTVSTNPMLFRNKATDAIMVGAPSLMNYNATGDITDPPGNGGFLDPNGRLKADLSSATAATINALRTAFQLQKYYERDARGGTRYTEKVKSHFDVVSPDARLQRPEYLGGGVSYINVHPVPQTSVTAATPQGNLAAFGTGSIDNHGFTKSFTEHGIILILVCVDADLTYQQGMERTWFLRSATEWYWPTFAHLGEQAVLNKEIYCQGEGVAADALTFGYQERYAELRYKPSIITGLFRSTVAGTLDVWHLSEKFTSLPTLGSTFIKSDPPIDRVIAVPAEPHFIADFYFDYQHVRPMPVYGVPGLVDHF